MAGYGGVAEATRERMWKCRQGEERDRAQNKFAVGGGRQRRRGCHRAEDRAREVWQLTTAPRLREAAQAQTSERVKLCQALRARAREKLYARLAPLAGKGEPRRERLLGAVLTSGSVLIRSCGNCWCGGERCSLPMAARGKARPGLRWSMLLRLGAGWKDDHSIVSGRLAKGLKEVAATGARARMLVLWWCRCRRVSPLCHV